MFDVFYIYVVEWRELIKKRMLAASIAKRTSHYVRKSPYASVNVD